MLSLCKSQHKFSLLRGRERERERERDQIQWAILQYWVNCVRNGKEGWIGPSTKARKP